MKTPYEWVTVSIMESFHWNAHCFSTVRKIKTDFRKNGSRLGIYCLRRRINN